MNKKTLFLLFFFPMQLFGQIGVTTVAEKVEKSNNVPYDSLTNYCGENAYQYIGQEVFIKPGDDLLKQYGYPEFYTNYTQESSIENKYKINSKYNSDYEALVGRYFKIIDVIDNPYPKGNDKYYLKLKDKSNEEILYFKYNTTNNWFSETFIVVGYFEQLKNIYIGMDFVVRGRNWISSKNPMTDIYTGLPISSFNAGEIWKCTDVTLESKFNKLALILENDKKEHICINPSNVVSPTHYWIFAKFIADIYKKEFGIENWNLILDGRLKLGMTEQMCLLSWGTPDKINNTVVAGKKTEQWIYGDNYLYITNGKLTAIQQ